MFCLKRHQTRGRALQAQARAAAEHKADGARLRHAGNKAFQRGRLEEALKHYTEVCVRPVLGVALSRERVGACWDMKCADTQGAAWTLCLLVQWACCRILHVSELAAGLTPCSLQVNLFF